MYFKVGNLEFKKYTASTHSYRTSERLVLSVTLSSKDKKSGENDITGSSSRYNPPNRWGLRKIT